MYRRWRSDVRQEDATEFMHVQQTIHCISFSNRLRLLGYVCMYVNMTPPFSKLRNLKWQYSGCSMVCIDKCFAPWTSKKRKTNTHTVSALLDPALLFGLYRTLLHLDREPVDAALCVRAHTVCPEYHCWVYMYCMCVCGRCGWPVRKLRQPWDVWRLPHVQVWTMSTKGIFSGQEIPLTCPFSVVAPVHSYLLNV